jgi:RNA polymerase sigma-70 factor, ECF subfamily
MAHAISIRPIARGAQVSDHHAISSEPADEALAALIAKGDVAALSLIYDRYSRPVYALAAHLLGLDEAEDVVQETFLRLWLKADQFDAERGSFAAWFMAIARYESMARLRRLSLERRFSVAEDVENILATKADPGPGTEETVWGREQGELVLRALDELPSEQRAVLVLAYFGDLTQSAISERLQVPLGTVKKRISLGMQKLRTALVPNQASGDNRNAAQLNGLAQPRTGVPLHDGL